MNNKLKTAFIFSIVSLAAIHVFLFILLAINLFHLNAHYNFFIRAVEFTLFFIAPIVFSIIALCLVKNIHEGPRVFKILIIVFSWVTLGAIILYLFIVFVLLLWLGLLSL